MLRGNQSPGSVRTLAAELAKHNRTTYSSLEEVLEAYDVLNEARKEELYAELAEQVDKLRAFIADAAKDGVRVRFEVVD